MGFDEEVRAVHADRRADNEQREALHAEWEEELRTIWRDADEFCLRHGLPLGFKLYINEDDSGYVDYSDLEFYPGLILTANGTLEVEDRDVDEVVDSPTRGEAVLALTHWNEYVEEPGILATKTQGRPIQLIRRVGTAAPLRQVIAQRLAELLDWAAQEQIAARDRAHELEGQIDVLTHRVVELESQGLLGARRAKGLRKTIVTLRKSLEKELRVAGGPDC